MVVKSSKAASKKKVVKQLIPSFDMGSLYESILKKVEKQRNISPFVTPLVRISSGLLATDIITGGGIPTGRYTQWSGPEAGGKSTNAMTFAVSCAKHGIAMNKYHDAESAVTESLFKNIARHAGIKDHTDLFGVEGEGGAWLKPPIVRLYKESSAEAVLLALKDVYQRLPSKVFKKSDNTWYYAFADSKNALKTIQACGLGKPSDILYKQTGMYWCPAPDGDKPQAVSCLDSWPALLPPSFLSQDKDPSKQRAQIAAFISLYLSPIIGELASKHIIFTGINQVRANPNANFGCFTYHTRVLLPDGSTELIGKLVSQPGREVMSYNKTTGKLEAKPIVRGFKNGLASTDEFIRVSFDLRQRGHACPVRINVTKGHKVLTPNGEVSIGDLSVGDTVLSKNLMLTTSDDQKQFLYGAIIGDSQVKYQSNGFRLLWTHSEDQKVYLDWKLKMTGGYAYKKEVAYITHKGEDKICLSGYSSLLSANLLPPALNGVKKRNQKEIPLSLISKLTEKAIAVWFMDDGHHSSVNYSRDGYALKIACSRFSEVTRQNLANHIKELFKLSAVSVSKVGIRIQRKDDIDAFLKGVVKYVNPCFAYKFGGFSTKGIGSYNWKTAKQEAVIEVKIINIEPIKVRRQKYDLEIKGNHTYIVGANNGIIVHNSPEYEPCGNALKFNSSIRNQNRPRGYEGNGGKPVAVEASVEDNNQEDTYHYKLLKNTKNKTASPLLETWSRIWVSDYEGLGRGYDPVFDTYIYLKDTNQIVKGNKNKFTIKMGGQNDREYTWMDFKRAVIAEVTVSSAIRKKLMQELKLDKLPTIRKECFKQVKDGKGLEMFCLSKKIDPEAVSDDDDD